MKQLRCHMRLTQSTHYDTFFVTIVRVCVHVHTVFFARSVFLCWKMWEGGRDPISWMVSQACGGGVEDFAKSTNDSDSLLNFALKASGCSVCAVLLTLGCLVERSCLAVGRLN
jgi:hypothetical protein